MLCIAAGAKNHTFCPRPEGLDNLSSEENCISKATSAGQYAYNVRSGCLLLYSSTMQVRSQGLIPVLSPYEELCMIIVM
jgi:hypothetical protein